jgi:hypothetical protein
MVITIQVIGQLMLNIDDHELHIVVQNADSISAIEHAYQFRLNIILLDFLFSQLKQSIRVSHGLHVVLLEN